MLIPLLSHIHFIGIGGIGMSGIAELLYSLGYTVTGTDASSSATTDRLKSLGIGVFIGHKENHVQGAHVVVVSSAIKGQNPELLMAQKLKIPIIQRAEMLAELMRLRRSIAIAGTHGKTTTTSLVACVLDGSGMDPTIVNGGIINSYRTNARLGKGDWIVVEADESDGSFLKLFPTIAVVTNIDPEHMDHYPSFNHLQNAFFEFVKKIPFYGLSILCIDHPHVKYLSSILSNRRFITYGFCEEAQVRAVNLRLTPNGSFFDVDFSKETWEGNVHPLPSRIKDVFIPMIGKHNVQNALVAITVAVEFGIEESSFKKSLAEFKGVHRRFTKVGESNGVTVIDDYAHHPTEIKAAIEAALIFSKGKVLVVVQPHRYTRLSDCFKDFTTCFLGAFAVIVTPVYSAGEQPIEGISSSSLAKALKDIPVVLEIEKQDELPCLLSNFATPGDLILCLGAGNISHWAAALPASLDSFWSKKSLKLGNV